MPRFVILLLALLSVVGIGHGLSRVRALDRSVYVDFKVSRHKKVRPLFRFRPKCFVIRASHFFEQTVGLLPIAFTASPLDTVRDVPGLEARVIDLQNHSPLIASARACRQGLTVLATAEGSAKNIRIGSIV